MLPLLKCCIPAAAHQPPRHHQDM